MAYYKWISGNICSEYFQQTVELIAAAGKGWEFKETLTCILRKQEINARTELK